MNIGRNGSGDSADVSTGSWRARIERAPAAAPRVPTRLYVANARVRRPEAAASATIDCSTERNGPTSVPVGLVAPRPTARGAMRKVGAAARIVPATATSNPETTIAVRPAE